MKKILTLIAIALLALPVISLAAPVSWDFTSSVLQPLRSAWNSQIKGAYFTATSTTDTNTFPRYTATNGTTTNATSTNLNVSNTFRFGGVSGTTWGAFCTSITGGAGLCDGVDDGGGAGGAGLATSTAIADTYVIYGTSAGTVGAEAAFNYDDATNILTVDNGLFTNATATNLGATGVNLFGGGLKTTNNSLCIQLTGSSALCDGDDATGGGGGGVSDWTQSLFAGMLAPTTTIGIRVSASSTFDGALTVSSSTPDYINPIFKVSTSTDIHGELLGMYATTSNMIHTSSLTSFEQESGARITIGDGGYFGMPVPLDQVDFAGRVRNSAWENVYCVVPTWYTAISADGLTACREIVFGEATAATLSNAVGNGYPAAILSTSGNDAGWTGYGGGTFLQFGTSTPSFEITARITGIAATATTSAYMIGYTNHSNLGAPTVTEPTAGCFFIASSTLANWNATCRTALGTGTLVDTGIASTTILAGSGAYRKFRIDADSTSAKFYMTDGSKNLRQVATISTTYPASTLLQAGLTVKNQGAVAQTVSLTFFGFDLWFRKVIPNL